MICGPVFLNKKINKKDENKNKIKTKWKWKWKT